MKCEELDIESDRTNAMTYRPGSFSNLMGFLQDLLAKWTECQLNSQTYTYRFLAESQRFADRGSVRSQEISRPLSPLPTHDGFLEGKGFNSNL